MLKVKLYQDDNYIVYNYSDEEYDDEKTEILFKGSLADCESYIRLTEAGRL